MLFFFLESIPGCIFLVEYSWIVILLFIVLLTQTRDSLRTISPGCAPIPVSRDASPSRLLRSPSPGFCGMRTNFRIPGCVPIPMSRDTSPSRLLRSPSPGFCGSSSSLRSPSPGFCGMRTNFLIPGCVPIPVSRDASPIFRDYTAYFCQISLGLAKTLAKYYKA